MKSSSGAHYLALDHVRALAAYLVLAWHFVHGHTGDFPVPAETVTSVFPLSIVDQGHTGVALFMTLSGYLFAKLLDGKSIDYGAFIWNRALRLLPLLFVVIAIGAVGNLHAGKLPQFLHDVALGPVMPSLPNGGWSITVEFHFYLVLPLFLWLLAKSRSLPLSILVVSTLVRVVLYRAGEDVFFISYGTIVGRIDQFALGLLAFQYRREIAAHFVAAIGIVIAFMLFYWWFDLQGGLNTSPEHQSLWIVMPTIEGFAYAVAIATYDARYVPGGGRFAALVGKAGEYSYSIYLLHFFAVFKVARLVHERVMDISSFPLACLWAFAFYVAMMVPAYLSYRFIEAPFLRLRRRYVR